MNPMYIGGALTLGIGYLGYSAYKKFNKNSSENEIIKLENLFVKNLTPHKISIYSDDNKFLYSLKPEDKKYQLRLVSDKESTSENIELLSLNYEESFLTLKNTEEGKKLIEKYKLWGWYDDWFGGDYISAKIPIKHPVKYSKVEGLDEVINDSINHYRNEGFNGVPHKYDFIVSTMVADYLMKNKEKYKYSCHKVLVPDTNPGSVVRDEDGKILGVKGLICYGDLSDLGNDSKL